MVTDSCAQYQINGYQLRMFHCNEGTFLSSSGSYRMISLTENVFFVRVAVHADSVITAFSRLFS